MRSLTLCPSLVLLLIVLAYWQSDSLPSRPENVPPSAVFLRAPNVGFPISPRGRWLACSFDGRSRSEHCVVTSRDGTTEYQGIFAPYKSKGSGADHAWIDAKTTREANVWIHGALVPIVHLKDGSISDSS